LFPERGRVVFPGAKSAYSNPNLKGNFPGGPLKIKVFPEKFGSEVEKAAFLVGQIGPLINRPL